MYKNCFFILALVSYASCGYCQFNDSVHHHVNLSSTGVYNQTKDLRSFVLNNKINFEVNQKRIAFNAGGGWVYGEQQRQLSNNDWTATANLDYLKDVRKLYYWALAGFDKSYSLNINYRYQSGAGVGYTFVNTPHFNLQASDGFLYESGDLVDPVVGKDVYQTLRNSLRIKYSWSYRERFTLSGTNFIQPSVISSDYVFKFNNQLSVKLYKWLALAASIDYNRITRTDRENLLLTFGITVGEYF